MRFVIDLNIIRSAWTGINPRGVLDYHCISLLTQIVNKHHEIVVTKEIDRKYQSLFDELKMSSRQGPTALNVVRLYYTSKQMGIVNNARCSSDVPHLPDESNIKDEDRDFARLANLTRSLLVTYDEPLIKELESLGVQAVKPNDANRLADP